MKLPLGKNDIFNCPEGRYRGILERIAEPKTPVKKPCKNQIRFTYRIKTSTGKEHLVGRTFCADLSYGSELYSFIQSWMDEKLESFQDDGGQVDLNLLVGKDADLLITHWDDGKERDFPFVKIAGIFPPGKLIED